MIGKISKGGGFRGVLDYTLDEEKGAEIVGGNMAGDNPRELASEFGAMRAGSQVQKPVFHTALSLPPGERVSSEKLGAISERYTQLLGLEKNQWVAVEHRDRDHQHIHIIANRIGADGKTWADSHDYRRQEAALRQIEKEFGLERLEDHQPQDTGRFHDLRGKIDAAIKEARQAPAGDRAERFKDALEKQGIQIKLNQSPTTGRVSGISYKDDSGRLIKGSEIGKGYSWGGTERRLAGGRASVKVGKAGKGGGAGKTKLPGISPISLGRKMPGGGLVLKMPGGSLGAALKNPAGLAMSLTASTIKKAMEME